MLRLAQSTALSLHRSMSRDAAPAGAAALKVRTTPSAVASEPGADSAAPQVLFCGLEFNDGFKLTAKELAADPRFDVAACKREDVAAHIADAHIAVRGRARCRIGPTAGARPTARSTPRRFAASKSAELTCLPRCVSQVPLMTRLDAQLLARAPALRYVLQFGVGLEARCVVRPPQTAR